MKDKLNIIMYLLSRDEDFLPNNFSTMELRKLRKKTDLQRVRLSKRLISELISEMKSTNTMFLFEETTQITPII